MDIRDFSVSYGRLIDYRDVQPNLALPGGIARPGRKKNNMNSILVTGGAGFIGSNFVRYLMARTDSNVIVLDKLTYAGIRANLAEFDADKRFQFVEGDIADHGIVDDLFSRYQPDAVVNLAAESHVDRSIDGPEAFIRTNIVGTFVLLNAARTYVAAAGAAMARDFRFLHVSTDEVYGSLGSEGRFTEQTPYSPNSPYAASKAAADHLVRSWFRTYELPVLLTNCSNNFGPYQFPEKLIPLMTLNALEARELPIYGDGSNIRDWIYVEDHCDGLYTVLERGRPGEQYNIGADNEKSNLETIDTLIGQLERIRPAAGNADLKAGGKTRYDDLKTYVTDRPGHDFRYAIDSGKIRDELGWQPAVGFEEGMKRTVEWYIGNPEWCRSVLNDEYNRERLGLGDKDSMSSASS